MNSRSKSEVFMENILRPMMVFSISPTEEDSDCLRNNLFKI